MNKIIASIENAYFRWNWLYKVDGAAALTLRGIIVSLALSLLVLPIPIAASQASAVSLPNAVTAPATPLGAMGLNNSRELEAFVDAYFTKSLKDFNIPGASIAIVKDGRVILSKGYGYANLQTHTPFNPSKTVLRAKSVSKLFTATAVMQIHERGLVQMNDDVNKYLRTFQLPATFPQPVTLANLLTHTSGFEDRSIGTAAANEADLLPLGVYLARSLPPRILPPGDEIIYSDHNPALAGYVVESVSGVPFAQYMDENILQPLGMRNSSFRQPPPAELVRDLAVGYVERDGKAVPKETYLWNIAPAVGLVTTVDDMACFMIAHLEDGQVDGKRILQPATVQEMHRQHFTQNPALPGWAYGFGEIWQNNQRMITHSGWGNGFANWLYLLPDQHVGFFIASNFNRGDSDDQLADGFTTAFLDRYYPAQAPAAAQPMAGYAMRTQRFSGTYREPREDRYRLDKLGGLGGIKISANQDGTLSVGGTGRWIEIEKLLFRRIDGDGVMAFREDVQGRITHLFINGGALERIEWYETLPVMVALLGLTALVFVSAVFVWLIGKIRRRGLHVMRSRLVGVAQAATITMSTINLLFLAMLMQFLLSNHVIEGGGSLLDLGVPPVLIVLLSMPIASTALVGVMLVLLVPIWRERAWSWQARAHYTLITLAGLVFTGLLNYTNLLGFRF